MSDILEDIDEYVKNKIKELKTPQRTTLKILVLAGYKGERSYALENLLHSMGEKGISESGLIESFKYSIKDETAIYFRIKPEFFRAVRKYLFEE